eukprot:1158066-Pelagomonas_calceolata.AAC.3
MDTHAVICGAVPPSPDCSDRVHCHLWDHDLQLELQAPFIAPVQEGQMHAPTHAPAIEKRSGKADVDSALSNKVCIKSRSCCACYSQIRHKATDHIYMHRFPRWLQQETSALTAFLTRTKWLRHCASMLLRAEPGSGERTKWSPELYALKSLKMLYCMALRSLCDLQSLKKILSRETTTKAHSTCSNLLVCITEQVHAVPHRTRHVGGKVDRALRVCDVGGE